MLLFKLAKRCDIRVGQNLNLSFAPGLYGYVGSALGPGGLQARLRRHASVASRKHWHIDYLLPHTQLVGALMVLSRDRVECDLASWVGEVASLCFPGFGASDCKRKSHLFLIGGASRASVFIDKAASRVGAIFVSMEEILGERV